MGQPPPGPAPDTVGTAWNLACPDWADRLRAGRSLIPDLPIDRVAGDRAVKVWNMLRLADVPGTPRMAEAGGDWFRDIVRALFGSMHPITRQRMIRELFLLVPKKNSKTTNGALLSLTALLLNERPRAPMIMTAPVQKVADLAFSAAAGAIALDPVLSKKLHVRDHLKMITHRETKASLQIMTFDPDTLTGSKPVFALLDEIHILATIATAAKSIRQLRGGMHPFAESMLAMITTQSEEAPSGVFKDELQKARDIRDGKRAGTMLPVLYEFTTEMQQDKAFWQDPTNWPMVVPNLNRSIHLPRLIEEYQTAKDTSEAELRGWASQHLNVEIGLALMSDSWVGADYWKPNQKALPLDEVIERSEVITIGIDGGGLDDMLGLAVMGREVKTGRWLLWNHAWLHPIALERRKSEAPKYADFVRSGDLTIVEEIGEDITECVDVVAKIEATRLLDRVGVDQAGIGMIPDELQSRPGLMLKLDRIVGIPQGWRMVGSIKALERKLAEDGVDHGSRPLMTWCVGNAKVEARGNAILITKQAAGTAKIDPLSATFNAVALMGMNPQARQRKLVMFSVGGNPKGK